MEHGGGTELIVSDENRNAGISRFPVNRLKGVATSMLVFPARVFALHRRR